MILHFTKNDYNIWIIWRKYVFYLYIEKKKRDIILKYL